MFFNLSFGLSSSDSENFASQIVRFSGEANGQRPFASTKSTGDVSKVPEGEGEKPKTQVFIELGCRLKVKQQRSVGIHDGTFHADEVTACALLFVFGLIDADKIVRTRDPEKLSLCEFVCDVGGVYAPQQKRFDHHQVSYTGDLSSAGMILNYLKQQQVIGKDEFDHLNQHMVLGVDAHDNGRSVQEIGVCTFSHVIANFNPIQYDATPEDLKQAFTEAFLFTVGHVQRVHQRFCYNLSCREIVKNVMETSNICLFFERSLPWLDSFFALGGEVHPALFVIMPSGTQWKLRGIPPDNDHRMQVRLPLPARWAGLLGNELKMVSGIEGSVFCHKGRFTSVWTTREEAINALKYVLTQNKIKYEDTF